MKNIYYLIWIDGILNFKKHNPQRTDWKIAVFIMLTWMNSLNAWILFLWLKYFNIFTIKDIPIKLFPGEKINDFLSFTIQFALPFVILNYFLIFYRNRYKKLIIRYDNIKTGYALIYSLTIIFGAFLSAILYGILK